MLTEMMADTCVHWDTLSKHGPVNSKKYEAVLSILIQELEIKLQDCREKK